jgi:hypothetical protein
MSTAKRDGNFVTTLLAVSSVDGVTPVTLYANPTTHRLLVDLAGGGSGTVQTISIASANGFAGTSDANPTNPQLTISTSITGILKGNGTAVSAVTVGSGLSFDGTTLSATAGGGNVSNTGTPLNNQIAVWTDATTIEGDSALTFDTATDTLTTGTVNSTTLTASEIVITDGSKNLVSAAVATYPSLTELTYLKGVTSGIQGQINGKQATISFGTGVLTALGVNIGSAGAVVLFDGALGTPSSGTVTNLTGTASININGTVGATTPTTGVFTTATVNTGLMPDANDGAYLGQAGTAFSDLFLAEGGVINWDSGDVTLTQTGNVLAVAGGDLRVATADVGTNADSVPTLSSTSTLTNKTLTSPTITTASLSGTQLLAESASIGLDPSGSADGAYSGITMTGTAGYTQAFGDLVYLASSDSRWEAVDADAASTSDRLIAMVVVAGTDGNSCTLLMQGTIRADAKFPTLTIGSAVYAGETPGEIQVAIPTGADCVIRRVGYALTADSIYFNPSMDSQIAVA